MNRNDELYAQARTTFGATLRRLARGYEADADRRRDLLQEMHIALWRSLRLFNGDCSLQTWVYRIAHNVAASHILGSRRASARLVDLETLEAEPGVVDGEEQAHRQYQIGQLLDRIYRLKPLERQVILLYLEGESAASIAEITGLSEPNVATKIHRIKRLLSQQSSGGPMNGTK